MTDKTLTPSWRHELRNRYVFTGTLVMQTALHIGGGRSSGGINSLSSSDNPVVMTPDQKPYIPGSSFKGALRSTVEKIATNLPGLTSCGLPTDEDPDATCPTAKQKTINEEQRKQEQERNMTSEKRKQAADQLRTQLCHTCQLFGSPYAAARVNINDLYVIPDSWSGAFQKRDGVAIDRDSEKAKDRLKYDFEVVPAQTIFELKITLENATEADLQLLCVGLSEYVYGFGAIGGKRSRGLGVGCIDKLEVKALELIGHDSNGQPITDQIRKERMRNYLVKQEFSSVYPDGKVFLNKWIEHIFEEQ